MNGWKAYSKRFGDFVAAISQTELISQAAAHSLKEFPRLPFVPPITARIATDAHTSKVTYSRPTDRPIVIPYVTMIGRRIQNPEGKVDFSGAILSEQVAMLIAHTEAFLADTLRAICIEHPGRIRASQAQITWQDALAYRGRASLLRGLVDRFVDTRLRGADLRDTLSILIKDFGLEFQPDEDTLVDLRLGEQIRHLVVHNGGRIDAQFARQVGIPLKRTGQPYPLDEHFVQKLATACDIAAIDVFFATALKCFGFADVDDIDVDDAGIIFDYHFERWRIRRNADH